MKTFIKLFTIVFLLISIISCQDSNRVKTVTINDQYSVDLPIFLAETNDLNDDASLQYCNLLKEFYVIIIDESKKEFNDILEEYELDEVYPTNFEGYTELLATSFENSLLSAEISDFEKKDINGLTANLRNATGIIDGIEIFYKVAYVEGSDNYYQIMLWTLPKHKDKFSDKMDKIIYSFKEI